jgi:hypothetical protein
VSVQDGTYAPTHLHRYVSQQYGLRPVLLYACLAQTIGSILRALSSPLGMRRDCERSTHLTCNRQLHGPFVQHSSDFIVHWSGDWLDLQSVHNVPAVTCCWRVVWR